MLRKPLAVLAALSLIDRPRQRPVGLDRRRRPADQPARLRRHARHRRRPSTMTAACPTNAPDRNGKPITVVDVPKLIGIGYFDATSKGIAEAAAEMGNVTATTDGPVEANIDDQITVIDNYITKGVDGILFAANDPVAIAPVLKKALAAGINVVGYDANSTPDARQWFVNQAEFNGIGKAMIDSLAAEVGEDGELRHRHLDLHHAEPGALDRRDGRLRRRMPPEPEVARDRRGAGGQHPLLQPGQHAHQQVRRRAEGHPRHDLGGDPGLGRRRDPGRPVRQDRRRRPRHAERDEALRRERLREVGGALEPGRPRLRRRLRAARRRRRHARSPAPPR